MIAYSEREGFEPPVTVKPRWFSKPEHSTTLPPFQQNCKKIITYIYRENQLTILGKFFFIWKFLKYHSCVYFKAHRKKKEWILSYFVFMELFLVDLYREALQNKQAYKPLKREEGLPAAAQNRREKNLKKESNFCNIPPMVPFLREGEIKKTKTKEKNLKVFSVQKILCRKDFQIFKHYENLFTTFTTWKRAFALL